MDTSCIPARPSAILALLALPALAADPNEFFESRIRPLLAANCHTCHTQAQMSGLRLDSREAILKGGANGPAIVPGNPDQSLLIQAVRRTHARFKMPPDAPLPASSVALLEDWIRQGAPWPAAASAAKQPARSHWAYQPVRKPAVPSVKNTAWPRTSVDNFILARLEEKKLKPAAPADKHTWLRRVTLDLTGLPPAPEEIDAFVNDNSSQGRSRVIDRLLASPHYGERWARHWLDLARYSDGRLAAGVDTPLPNAWRYRDWVVDAFNKDLPYDVFVKAQIAADLFPPGQRAALLPALGFQSLGNNANDQVDTTTKVFLGLTVGCAQCHDHKYDPIPTRDYYSLYGIFRSSASYDDPLVPAETVTSWKAQKDRIDALKETIDDFLKTQTEQLIGILARDTARYMLAAWKGQTDVPGLDKETLQRWTRYLADPNKEHSYLKPWFDLLKSAPIEAQVATAAHDYQTFALSLIEEAREVDDKNYVAFGGRKGQKDERTRQYTNIVSLPVLKFYAWREIASEPYRKDGHGVAGGVYYYGPRQIDRFITGTWRTYLDSLRAELAVLEKALPPMYPYLHALRDAAKPADARVQIRGEASNLGEVAPRQFLSVLSDGEPRRFTKGSGRLELAEAIASPANPLTARVIVNRIWQHHFGAGIVASPSNFGSTGEPPTHPELLDYLATRLIESNWSLKTIHREILLSSAYALSSQPVEANEYTDPANKLLWRANVTHRLDWETLRDSILAVTGTLDTNVGGPPAPLNDKTARRALYLTVSRTRLDETMALFDFPDANATAETRATTAGPLQGLYFLNSPFVATQSKALAQRLEKEAGQDPSNRLQRAYKLLYNRAPDPSELALARDFLATSTWPQYLQTLLASAEFTSVN